jgi:hypothetical protein
VLFHRRRCDFSITYLRTKGQLEDDLSKLGFPSVTILRPGVLEGERNDHRPLEIVAGEILRRLRPFIPRRYRLSPATVVAKLLIDGAVAGLPGRHIGKSGSEICAQLKDPKRNGGRDAVGLLEHLRHDASLNGFIPRGWEPGAGRSTPPGTFEDHVKDMALWAAAGQPCPN